MKNIIKMLQEIEESKDNSNKYDLICSLGAIVTLINLKIDKLENGEDI